MANEYAVIHVATNVSVEKEEKRQARLKKKKQQEFKQLASKTTTLTIATASLVNSAVGSYTGNRMRQSNTQVILGASALAVGMFFNPVASAITATTIVMKGLIDEHIRTINSQQEGNYRRSYKGNMTTSGSRWKGGS